MRLGLAPTMFAQDDRQQAQTEEDRGGGLGDGRDRRKGLCIDRIAQTVAEAFIGPTGPDQAFAIPGAVRTPAAIRRTVGRHSTMSRPKNCWSSGKSGHDRPRSRESPNARGRH